MSGSAVKASAREIRRAFGHQAVDTVEQVKIGLRHHSVQLIEVRTDLQALERRFLARLEEHERAFTLQQTKLDRFQAMTWRDRLKWIIGR